MNLHYSINYLSHIYMDITEHGEIERGIALQKYR